MFFQPVLQLPVWHEFPFICTTRWRHLRWPYIYEVFIFLTISWFGPDTNAKITTVRSAPSVRRKIWIEGHGPVGFWFSPQKIELCPRKNGHCPHFDRMVWPETWSVSNLFGPLFCWGFRTELGWVDRWIWENTFSPSAYLAKPTRFSGHSIDAAQWGFVGLAGTSKEASKKGP